MRLNAQQLRNLEASTPPPKINRRPLYLILDSVYDTYNVGGLFRLADALAMEKIYLCGRTSIPPDHKIQKASVGTYKIVPWEYAETAESVIEKLKITKKITIVAVEQHKNAFPYTQARYELPLALIVGNETAGVAEETLKLADMIVEIPMFGINKSLNVIVSAAIVAYHIESNLPSALSKKSDLGV